MSTYEPGTVAVATVRGVENVRVMAGYGTSEPHLRWLTTDVRLVDPTNDGWYFAYEVTDVRPLVVLDLDLYAHIGLGPLIEDLRRDGYHSIADQIEAQTKPPRIPEPGLWGVVETTFKEGRSRHGWAVRRLTDGDADWQDGSGDYHRWVDLIDPTLIREGVES